MIYVNDEDLGKLHNKLEILLICSEIKELGFSYKNNSCIPFFDENSYTQCQESDTIYAVIEPTIEEEGDLQFNSNILDKLYELDIDIPVDVYVERMSNIHSSDVMGFTIFMKNKWTRLYYQYNIPENNDLKKILEDLNYCCAGDISSVSETQVRFKDEGVYIVLPDEYVYIEHFLESYFDLLKHIIEQVKKYENNIKEEVA